MVTSNFDHVAALRAAAERAWALRVHDRRAAIRAALRLAELQAAHANNEVARIRAEIAAEEEAQ